MYDVRHYLTEDGKDLYETWLLKVRDTKARVATVNRITRASFGNFGDHKFCRDGVWEMRIDIGAGYRVYYAIADQKVILLLLGGDKRKQSSDISMACKNWENWQERNQDER
jgi:putative addiction module killer protein